MNPDSNTFGSRKKNDTCIAWAWVVARVEMKRPSPRLAMMNNSATA